jgi:hypothetical protein
MSLPCPPFWLQPDPVPCVNPSEEYQSMYSVRRPGVTIAAVRMLPLDIHVTSPCRYFIIVHNSMFVTVGYLGTLKCRGTVYLGAEGTMERKELGPLNPFCEEKSSIPLSTNKAIMAGFLSSRGCVD